MDNLKESAMSHLRPLFTWRSAIVESDLPPVTRHVALTLSLHMNERGGSCFPSHPTLAAETGLHVDTVRTHLAALTKGGWLARVVNRRGSGRGTRVEYEASVPTTGVESSTGLSSTGLSSTALLNDHWGRGPSTTGVHDPSQEDVMSTSREEAPLTHFDILCKLRAQGEISSSLPQLGEIAQALRHLGIPAEEGAIREHVVADAS